MKKNSFFIGSIAAILLATAVSVPMQNSQMVGGETDTTATTTATVAADTSTTYTDAENAAIQAYQKQYAQLIANDTVANIFEKAPVLTDSFDPGVLKQSVIDQTVNWINYYRGLAGIHSVIEDTNSDQLAQISSAVMASAESNPYKNQHGLKNTEQPANISDLYWNRAVYGTDSSDLYFGWPKTIGDPIRELILDNTNISGLDVGHRAWLLSPYLTTVGIGIAQSNSNGRQYQSIMVRNPTDANRTPSSSVVTFPSAGLFPVEEMSAGTGATAVPWSIMFAQNENLVGDDTTITVTNLTDGTTGDVSPSYSGSQAYSKTVVSFLPPENVTINDHSEYQVTANNLNSTSVPTYSYKFKTFSEKASSTDSATGTQNPETQNTENSN